MVRALPDFLIDGCGKMISPVAVDTPFDLEFDGFTAELFGNLHLSLFWTGTWLFGLSVNRLIVNPYFVNDDVGATKNIIRNRPLLLETLQRRRIHDEMNRDFVRDGYLSRIGSIQNSRRQFSRLLADLVKVSAVIEQ